MIIAAIDPGIKNFAFSVENVCTNTILETKDNELKLLCSETIFFDNFIIDPPTTQTITNLLKRYDHIWSICDIVLVERQMQFKGIINTDALRVSHHCLSFFELLYPSVHVINYQASRKTVVLNAPKGLTKPERKKWSILKATQIYNDRGDTYSHNKRLNASYKLDDVSDCLLMCLSYIITHTK